MRSRTGPAGTTSTGGPTRSSGAGTAPGRCGCAAVVRRTAAGGDGLLDRRGARPGPARPLRQPAGVGLPVLLVRVRGRHVATPLRRCGRRPEGRPGVRPGAPAGLRHADRARVRGRARHPQIRRAVPAGAGRRGAGRPSARTAGRPGAAASTCRERPAARRTAVRRTATTTTGTPRSTGGRPSCGDASRSRSADCSPAAPGLRPAEFGRRCRLSFVKVAEFQRRAVVHFHALIRLDGPDDYVPPAVASRRGRAGRRDPGRRCRGAADCRACPTRTGVRCGSASRPTPSQSTATRPAS